MTNFILVGMVIRARIYKIEFYIGSRIYFERKIFDLLKYMYLDRKFSNKGYFYFIIHSNFINRRKLEISDIILFFRS